MGSSFAIIKHMQRILFVFIISFLFGQSLLWAQMPGEPIPNSPEWQLTLDVVKAKAQKLIQRNASLMAQHGALTDEYNKIQEQIRDVRLKNDALREFLKERHGQSDQQLHIEDLNNQIKAKRGQVQKQKQELLKVQKQAEEVKHKLDLKKLKTSEKDLERREQSLKANAERLLQQQAVVAQKDRELITLKEKLQKEKDVEDSLEKQLADLKAAQLPPPDPVNAAELRSLQMQLQMLAQKKEDLQKKNNVDNSQVKDQRYEQLFSKKQELESKIKEYEEQLNQLRNPNTFAFAGGQTKQVLHQMIEIDKRNTQLRQRIKDLREDISVLKDQVNRLERKVKFNQDSSDYKK